MLTKEEKKTNEQKVREFEKRVDMLALTLSLKRNDRVFHTGEGYQLLFSTYIKMLENDQNDFFIEKERKEKIIESLKRTKAFYDFKKKRQLHAVFETMTNDDPTDFMLFPSTMYVEKDVKAPRHLVGLTVYKKKNRFFVMKVDTEHFYDRSSVSYFQIPLSNIEKLSHLFFLERDIKNTEQYYILKTLAELSNEARPISSVILKKQSVGNCIVSQVETSLSMILFNCRTDLFRSMHKEITPKWNLKHLEPTLEMRRRFLLAVKGEDKDWNQHFDYIFDYYLYKKGKLVEIPFSYIDIKGKWWHQQIHLIFSVDPYIPEMLENGGQISNENKEQLKANIRSLIEPPGRLCNEDIRKIEVGQLSLVKNQNCDTIKVLSARLSSIKIEVAKKMAEVLIACLEEKNREIVTEIKQREKNKKERLGREYDKQTLSQLVSKVSQNNPTSFSQVASPRLNEQATFANLIHNINMKKYESKFQGKKQLVTKQQTPISELQK